MRVWFQPQDFGLMAQVKLGDVIGVLPGFLQAGRLMVEKEVFFKAAGLQQTLEQVVGEFQQPQTVTNLPVHLEAENGEHQDRQHAEQEGQDDLAPDLVSGFFHQWVFYSPSVGSSPYPGNTNIFCNRYKFSKNL